jgi:hypothetical protein
MSALIVNPYQKKFLDSPQKQKQINVFWLEPDSLLIDKVFNRTKKSYGGCISSRMANICSFMEIICMVNPPPFKKNNCKKHLFATATLCLIDTFSFHWI